MLHLLDATYELFRAYFAMPSRTDPSGQEVNAVYGLITSTLALLREPGITHVGAATDHVIESFRNDLFGGYKTGESIDPQLLAQFPLAEEALHALGIVVWPMVAFEADDALATAAQRFAPQTSRVIILSPDKDLAQCVIGEHVVTYDRLRHKYYDEAAVCGKFGVPPASIPDLLALTGDAADGIPGIPGWGRKSAAAVLSVYESIEAIPQDWREWSIKPRQAARLANVLAAQRPKALLYKKLATLRTDVPLRERLVDLQWKGVPREEYTALCRRLGFDNLSSRPSRWANH